ncbi:MAG: Rieske 2Fe-2S domain-containing protein [Dehalococcoidia bacterium]|nr:Rieske 2Fe-2S domain-containing protein [Dehalococcoidia bacterium]
MLTLEENEAFTRVGSETPMGRLLRWYWHPIAASTQLDENPVMPVKLLGESLVLYRDRSGTLGLVQQECGHRRVNLVFGIPEEEGLRCPYHGWRYDETGQCQEMPSEPPESTFPDRVKLLAYPVQELAGLIFAYLGPQPAPLLPRWDLFVCDGVRRDIGFQVLPCNWLQMQENDLDPAHLPWLHGHFTNYVLERLGRPDLIRGGGPGRERAPDAARRGNIQRWRDWEIYEHGVMNLELVEGEKKMVRPSLFPNMNSFSTEFMYRVPMDDTHTLHVFFTAYPLPPGEADDQTKVPYYILPASVDQQGLPVWGELDSNGGQDSMAWVAQGPIVDRSKEKLAESDKGIILWRELLRRQMEIVEDGGEPMNTFRNPEENVRINVAPRDESPLEWPGDNGGFMRRTNGPFKYSPLVKGWVEKFRGKEALIGPVH